MNLFLQYDRKLSYFEHEKETLEKNTFCREILEIGWWMILIYDFDDLLLELGYVYTYIPEFETWATWHIND